MNHATPPNAIPHPSPGFRYLTPTQYWELAQISPASFWRRVKAGAIPIVKFGPRCTRVPIPSEAA